MIKEHCFEKEYIRNLRKVYKKANPVFVEKTIYAFELLSLLIKSGMNFVFKGGTSLLLLIPEPQRLSVDVDIIGKIDLTELDSIITDSRFTKFEPDKRKNDKDCIKHFKFYYNSAFVKQKDSNLLLDIVLKTPVYKRIISNNIQTPFFETEEEINVNIPSINSLLSDKLTAFAPNTIGIPYDENSVSRRTGIIKQLYDISILFDKVNDFLEIKENYKKIHTQECNIREKEFTLEEALQDSVDTSYLICQSGLKGSINNNQLKMLRFGCNDLRNYLLNDTFSLDAAKTPAAKAAFIATLIKKNKIALNLSNFKFHHNKTDKIKDVMLSDKYTILNKLKTINPEAFYYWNLISQIEEGKL